MQFSKTRPPKSGETSEKSSGENRVKSCHVCGCHGFFGPELLILLRDRPSLELIIVSSNYQALLFLQDQLLESV